MMHKYLFFILFVVFGSVRAQSTINGSFVHEGITRTYSFYVPASYVPGEAVPLILNLHGLSTDGAYQEQYRDFRPVADTANFIVAHPDGSMLLGQRFWNYDTLFGSTVDDIGFLETLIDTIVAHYTIHPMRIYAVGVSNGGFMCYALACRSDRFAAIGAVTGSMSTGMYEECDPEYPIPVIHIHGTEDNVNPYEGTSTMTGIEETVRFWVDRNNCDTVPVINEVPDINISDNATATRYLYSGGINEHTIELFKVNGGGHSWPGSPVPGSSETVCLDFDARKEIWRFFSQYQRDEVISVSEHESEVPAIWPNPASGILHIRASEDRPVTGIAILDMQGRVVEKQSGKRIQIVDVRHLRAGTYIIQASNGISFSSHKLVIADRD